MKPCGACCLRGDPSGCEYSFTGQDRQYIEQNALIDNLWRSCQTLRHQLNDARRMLNERPRSSSSSSRQQQKKKLQLASGDEQEDTKEPLDNKDKLGEHAGVRILSTLGHMSPVAKENRVLTTPASANQLLDILLERLVDDFGPESAVKTGSVVCWRTAVEMRVLSPLLGRAFTAAALTLAGYREQNYSFQMAGQGRYVRTLRSLQETLYHPTESKSTAALIVVVLFTIIEVLFCA